jgi:hypothetical protein
MHTQASLVDFIPISLSTGINLTPFISVTSFVQFSISILDPIDQEKVL